MKFYCTIFWWPKSSENPIQTVYVGSMVNKTTYNSINNTINDGFLGF